MKEQLYTIPLNDAANADDECLFCFIQRKLEQDLLDFVLGSSSSYMEADIRELTDKAGFCREHFRQMFHYGNTLGNALILKTHYQRTLREMEQEFKGFKPGRISLKDKLRGGSGQGNSVSMWIRKREQSCYICEHFADTYDRYMDTFFYLWKQDDAFREKIVKGKGFCLPHLGDLCDAADGKLSDKERQDFYDAVLPLTQRNMERLLEDVSWMVDKFDYRNKDADWKNSRDAIQRGMQKLKGGHPAEPPYKSSK